MTPRFVFRPEAQDELREARNWYAAQAEGLELEFGRAVDAALARLARFPESGVLVKDDIRRTVLRRFPYQLVYYREGDDLVILGCYHLRREPRSWRPRR
jgi:plasmid stabilization system protein ParE